MRTSWITGVAAIAIGASAMVGCDEQKTPEAKQAEGQQKAAETMADANKKAADVIADGQKKASEQAADANKKAADMANDAKADASKMADKANDAADTVVAQAQKLYDQAKEAINKADLTGAQQYVDQLAALKSKLPADWQAKVDELTKMLADAKSKMNGLTMPKLN